MTLVVDLKSLGQNDTTTYTTYAHVQCTAVPQNGTCRRSKMMKWLTQAETIHPDVGGEKTGFVVFIWKEGALLHIAFRTGHTVDASGGGEEGTSCSFSVWSTGLVLSHGQHLFIIRVCYV